MNWTEPNFVANGNVSPGRFVVIDTAYTAGLRVKQAPSGGDRNIGVSQKGTRNPGGLGSDDGYAAISGEDLRVHVGGEVTGLELGGTVLVGASLKSDSNGAGVSTTTTSDIIGAIALQAGVSGDVINVLVLNPMPYG